MYIYNYLHIWRAVCNGKNPSANNYAADTHFFAYSDSISRGPTAL